MNRHPNEMREYQRKAVFHQLYNPQSMLWLGMSLGKTVITLTTIEHLMRAKTVKKTLVFGPVRVIHAVWEKEARKWQHLNHLRFSVVHGDEEKRLRALFIDADIYLCNYENMAWLSNILMHYYLSQGKPIPFQMCIYDEITRCKNSTSQRIEGGTRSYNRDKPNQYSVNFVGWRKILNHFMFTTGLTGTPASKGYIDLHGQYLCVDGGKRLGKFITYYRNDYFAKGFNGFGYVPTELGKAAIEAKIAGITLEMKTRDYLELPPVIIEDIYVDLPPRLRVKYDELERDMFTALDSGTEIEVFNQASVSNKCLQFCNGSVFTEPGQPEWENVHDLKFEVLDSIVEEEGGNPIAVTYNFVPDAERLASRYGKKPRRAVRVNKVPVTKIGDMIEDWQKGMIDVLIGHPASMGHGLDGLQDKGDVVVMFGLNWSLELYDQVIWRFMRSGRITPLRIFRIMIKDTVDIAVREALSMRRTDETGLRDAIKKYRREKLNLIY